MKALPVTLVPGEGYVPATVEEATHVTLNFPGPVGSLTLPVIRYGTRKDTGCWTWNGNVEKPTLRPSVLTKGHTLLGGDKPVHCHTWVTDGQAQFLNDTTHTLRGTTVDMLEVTQ